MDSQHIFLVSGIDYAACKILVDRFLRQNLLVRYSSVDFDDNQGISSEQEKPFWDKLDWCHEQNMLIIRGFISELEDLGYESLQDLAEMKQGYESKILHTVTHLLDGFFGLDSFFYNLEEDSHLLSPRLEQQIKNNPKEKYYLVFAQGRFQSADEADKVPQMRRMGVSSP